VSLLSNKYTGGLHTLQAITNNSSSPTWSSIIRAKNILKQGYSWRVGSGSSSFWFSNWNSLGPFGNHVPVIDIHDLQLSVRDVLSTTGNRTQALYTELPPAIADYINNLHIQFNDNIDDTLIWSENKNGTYSTKSGYNWLITHRDLTTDPLSHNSWSWLWRLKVPEKYKFFIWLACQNASPTLSLLHHKNMAPSATCTRCGEEEETFLHCVRDCRYSRCIWQKIGFTGTDFYAAATAYDWINFGISASRSPIFLAGLWWVWRHRNLMCLNNENWPLFRICNNILSSADAISSAFQNDDRSASSDRYVKWNSRDHQAPVLNVDGSCIGTPKRTGYSGVLRNSVGYYISGFSGFIPNTTDILLAELTAIHQGLILVIDMDMNDLVCYSDSLQAINLVMNEIPRYHTYAVLIQNIKDLLASQNISLHHTLREGNHCADFLAKYGASTDEEFVIHQTPPADLLPLLQADALGTSFVRH